MPFRSKAQRRFMHARHPEMAERWEAHTPKGADLPERAKMDPGGGITASAPGPVAPEAAAMRGKMQMAAGGFSRSEAKRIAKLVDLDFAREDFTLADFTEGLNVELEHADVTKKRAVATAKIALAHLRERGDYYRKLRDVEAAAMSDQTKVDALCERVGKMFQLPEESIERIKAKMRSHAGCAPTPSEIKAAMEYERTNGAGDANEKARKVANHLQERPGYYRELGQMLTVPAIAKAQGAGPFIGPRGGKWADPQFTIPYQEGGAQPGGAAPAQPPSAAPRAPGKPTTPKPLPSADSIGQQGMQVVAAIRQHDPETADQLEQALHAIVTGLRARQAGAKTPEGDEAIVENLKAFGRAFNQSAAPASVLGPDLGGMLEAAERAKKREQAEGEAQTADAMATAKQQLAAVGQRAKQGAPPSPEGVAGPAAAGTAQSAAVKPQAGAAEGAGQGAGEGEDEGPAPKIPPLFGEQDELRAPPAAGADDSGVVDVFGLGSPEEVNRRFGHDPQAAARAQASTEALARLEAMAGSREAEPASETEAALRDVQVMGAEREQQTAQRAQTREESAAFDRDLAQARARRDAVERAAAAQAERWAARQKGRRSSDVMREGLGEAPAEPAQPSRAPISDERAMARTMKPGRGAPPPAAPAAGPAKTIAPRRRPPAEAPLERALTPSMVKAIAGGKAAPYPSIGPSSGAAPVTETPAIPDYQDIYFQPLDDDRKRREEEAAANRRQADGEHSHGAFGFHGTGEVRLDPVLYYVPQVRTMAQVMGPQRAQRTPLVVPDMVKPRLEAGGSQSPKDGVPVQAQTDAGRVPRTPDRRDDGLAPAAPRPSPRLEDARAGAPRTSGEARPDAGPTLAVPVEREQAAAPPPEPRKAPPSAEDDEDDQRARAIVAKMSDEQLGTWTREGLIGFLGAGFRNARAFGFAKSEVVLESQYLDALYKGTGAHKYIRRVPTGNPKRPWRYYYRESAVARDVQAGEEVRVGKDTVKVHAVGKDGSIRIEIGGQPREVKPDEWANLLARSYGTRFHEWAEKRAEQSINAVLRHVPREALEDLPGDTDEERFEALRERVPAVYEKLQRSFQRAGVNPFRAKQILATALERRGWEPEARAAAVGSVLVKRTSPTSFTEIVRGAENLAGGARVTAGHVGAVVELRGTAPDKEDDFAARATDIAKRAEAELAKLSELLAKAQDGSNNDRAQALAAVLASSAIQKLNLLTTAFPGLRDRVADEARGIVVQAAAAAPHEEPKRHGGETSVYVAGEGGQPKAVKARYRLMSANEIIASHDPLKGFAKREDYPEGVQERAYHRDQSEQGKVIRNAQLLNPAFVANTNPDAVNGPPVVMQTAKGAIALGGNSRTMSMQRAYEHHEEKGEELRKYLREHAHEFGFRPEDIDAIDRPVLVREIEPDDRSKDAQRLLVRQLNESFTQGMDPRTMQVAMGRKLDEQALGALGNDMQGDETLASFLASPRSERFVNALQRAGIIDQRNANQYLKKGTKLLNEDGRVLVERILVGRMVGDADILSNTGARLVGNIASAVPYMVQAKAYGKGYDVGNDLAVALSAYNDLQHRVETGAIPGLDPKMDDRRFKGLFNYFDSLFGDKHPVVDNANARALLELLIRKPGPQQQAAVWRDYVKRAGQNPEGQASMFGPAKAPGDVLRETVNAALKREDDEKPAPKKAAEGPSLF